jgi:hypothetical protein
MRKDERTRLTIGGFDACIDGGVPQAPAHSSASFEVMIGAISSFFNETGWTP